MTFSLKRAGNATILGLGLMVAATERADAGLVLSVEAAGVQASTVSGVTTENFDSAPAGVYSNITNSSSAVGTFTSPGVAIVAANLYGGAGGTGTYFAIGAESGTTSATLKFNSAESYFGFWWSAADRNNALDLYSGGKLIASLSAANVLAALGSAYNGNPNMTTNNDSSEKFAYVNISGTNGTTIDQVVISNASTGTGFESDNYSVRSAPLTSISGTVIANGLSVPEPSSLVMASIGGLLGAGGWFRTRRRAITA